MTERERRQRAIARGRASLPPHLRDHTGAKGVLPCKPGGDDRPFERAVARKRPRYRSAQ